MRAYGIAAFAVTAAISGVAAQESSLAVSPLFSSHAVLQRDEPIRFWGTSEPGSLVSGTFAGSEFEAEADGAGRWEAVIDPKPAGGPFVLYVNSGDASIRSNNILVGDVWLCSGQSNMGWRLEQSDLGDRFIQAAGNEQLRVLQANRRTSHEPINAVDSRGWRPDASSYVPRFSAVGYHFGRLLQEETGVPIGLIEATWGGTPAEAWTPEPTLRANPSWAQPLLDKLPEYDLSPEELQSQVDAFEAKHADYIASILENEQGLAAGWQLPEHDDSEWTDINAPGFWEPVIGSVDGIVWLRRTVALSAD
ncbi:MAG: sialate O-acetylesterase, partial [Planctomycetota bacterium]